MGRLIKTACGSFFIYFILSMTTVAAAQGGLAQQMLTETNLARTAPQRYAGYIRDLRRQFQGKNYRLPGSTTQVMTSEGVPALDEAIRYLQRQPPLPALAWSQGLAEAAADLADDQGQSGGLGHTGRESGGMRERIERHGDWQSRIAENIGYGPDTARLMVMQLIIDDGVPGRGHRKNIFGLPFKVAGAACGPHPRYQSMCVMDFAAGFRGGDDR